MSATPGELAERGRGGALAWAALQETEGMGAALMLRLARVFGSAEEALRAPSGELMVRGGLSEKQAAQVRDAGKSLEAVRGRIDALARQGVKLLSMNDPTYPAGLLDLRTPPPLLYLRGDLLSEDGRAVAIIGTREPSSHGARLAGKLARGLAERGFTIVSGLARGIDTGGHRGALATRGGRTIAVLGCGLLRTYPPENGVLAARIAQRGCVMAEVPPETEVDRRLLLARDRIQAALSRAVIVVEAHLKCGSVVTAGHAVRCQRLLYAVPWAEPPFAQGWERLRKMGARPLDADADLDALVEEIESADIPPPQERLL